MEMLKGRVININFSIEDNKVINPLLSKRYSDIKKLESGPQ